MICCVVTAKRSHCISENLKAFRKFLNHSSYEQNTHLKYAAFFIISGIKTKPVLYDALLPSRAATGLLNSLKEGTLVFWMSKMILLIHFFSFHQLGQGKNSLDFPKTVSLRVCISKVNKMARHAWS